MPVKGTSTKSDTKKCPFCANEIKAKAIKCQYCGEFLNKKEKKGKEEKPEKISEEKANKIETFDETKIMSSKFEDLTEKEKGIRKAITYIDRAFGWGCFSIVVTLIIYIINLVKGTTTILDVSILDLIYGGVLVYFIFKRDRMASLFFFINFALSTIIIANNGAKIGAFRAFVAVFLFMGIIGAFRYHSLTNQKKLSKSEKIILVVGLIVTILTIIGLIAGE